MSHTNEKGIKSGGFAIKPPDGLFLRSKAQTLTEEDEEWTAQMRALMPTAAELANRRAMQSAEEDLNKLKRADARYRRARGADENTGNNSVIGTKTLADLSTGPAPDPLIGDFLTQDEPTILYGPGGVGKGMLSVYFAKRLTDNGRSVMVIDFEGHEGEWGRRAREMGFTDEQLQQVHYREPYGRSWEASTGTLHQIADQIKQDCDNLKISVIIVDSYTAATSGGGDMGGQEAAQEYFKALATIGRTSLTLAHVTGNSDKFPAKPFGSVFVHNFARETWAINTAEDAKTEIAFDASTNDLQPTVMPVELRNMKMSQRKKVPTPKFIAFSYFHDGHIEVDDQAGNAVLTIAEMAKGVLARANEPLTIKKITKLIEEDFGAKVSVEVMRGTLSRRHRGITFELHATSPLSFSVPQ